MAFDFVGNYMPESKGVKIRPYRHAITMTLFCPKLTKAPKPPNWNSAFPKSSYSARMRKTRYAEHQSECFGGEMRLFRGRRVVVTTGFRRMRGVLGASGPILAHFHRDVGPFLRIPNIGKTRYTASGILAHFCSKFGCHFCGIHTSRRALGHLVWNSARVRLTTGSRHARTTSLQLNP